MSTAQKPKKKMTRAQLKEALTVYADDNHKLATIILELRDELEKTNEYLNRYDSGEKPDPSRFYVKDLRTTEDLFFFIKEDFKGCSAIDMRKTFTTYKLNYALTDEEFLTVTNGIERQIQEEESEEFLEMREKWIKGVKEEETV